MTDTTPQVQELIEQLRSALRGLPQAHELADMADYDYLAHGFLQPRWGAAGKFVEYLRVDPTITLYRVNYSCTLGENSEQHRDKVCAELDEICAEILKIEEEAASVGFLIHPPCGEELSGGKKLTFVVEGTIEVG